MRKPTFKTTDYYDLWLFFVKEHGLTLLEGELDDIIHEVNEHEKRMKSHMATKTE